MNAIMVVLPSRIGLYMPTGMPYSCIAYVTLPKQASSSLGGPTIERPWYRLSYHRERNTSAWVAEVHSPFAGFISENLLVSKQFSVLLIGQVLCLFTDPLRPLHNHCCDRIRLQMTGIPGAALARHSWDTLWSLKYCVSKLFVLILCMPGPGLGQGSAKVSGVFVNGRLNQRKF